MGLYQPANTATNQPGIFYLRNTNAAGPADQQIPFGPVDTNLKPVGGDWENDGRDTIGLFDPDHISGTMTLWYLRNDNSAGLADLQFAYGMPFSQPIVGDWNGDGTDSVGVRQPNAGPNGIYHLRNTNDAGPANITFAFGGPDGAWTPLGGDWDGSSAGQVASWERRYAYDQWGNRTHVWGSLSSSTSSDLLQQTAINERNQVTGIVAGTQGLATFA